jgi:hypothetical protein
MLASACAELFTSWEAHSSRIAARRDGLGKRLRELYEKWDHLSGEARGWCEDEMQNVEIQLAALEPVDLDGRYRSCLADLQRIALVVNRTRRESPSRRKGVLVRQLIERIELTFEYSQHGQQTRSRLVSAGFIPLVRAAEAEVRLATAPGPAFSAQGLEHLIARLLAHSCSVPE